MQQISWYNKYFNNEILQKTEQNNKYIKMFDKRNIKTVKNQVLLIEKTYNKQLYDIKQIYTNQTKINEYLKLTSLELISKELNIIKLLSKYSLQNNFLEYDFFVNCIKLILQISNFLANRLKQKKIDHNNFVYNNGIPRCSYKFCNFKDSCIYNYNSNTKKLCYQDHYVHNMVSADIEILLEYINLNYKNNNLIQHNKEIQKSINTLSFVIGHMENELKSKCIYIEKDKWENFHVIRCKKNKKLL